MAENPKHIAIIMDGNGRWAQERGLPRAAGHQAGFKVARHIVECCGKLEIGALTLFAFSSENWRRPKAEVALLMDLFHGALRSEVDKLNENNVHMRFIGERSAFTPKLQQEMERAEQVTSGNSGLNLTIAVNFGGQWDIVEAARKTAIKVQEGTLKVEDISADQFQHETSMSGVTDPDLFIRTGGEHRLSNYLLWHLAYTELFFTDVLWPDFTRQELEDAIAHFLGRERRFGKTGAQLSKPGDA